MPVDTFTGPRSHIPGYNEDYHHYTATTRPLNLVREPGLREPVIM